MLSPKVLLILKCNFPTVVNKRLKWTSESVKLFSELFEIPIKDSKRYRFENKLPALSVDHLKASAALCEEINIPKQEWLKYPSLLKEKTENLQQQYMQLKEGGFTNVDAKVLALYRNVVHKKVSALKLHGFIPEMINVAECFISFLQPCPSDLPISDLTDDNNFGSIHHSILTRYLMWRFETTQETMEKFFRVYSLTRIKSFTFLSQNFALAEEFGFPPKRVLKYGYLLAVYPKYPRTVLTEMPVIAGMDMRKALQTHPRLIAIPPKQYTEIYGYLKKANIPDEAIRSCMNIFHVCPKTVKARLEEIQAIPELKVLISNPRILKVIVNHNEARSRLSFLQEVKLKCATATILSTDPESFNVYVRGGKDLNSTNDVVVFVQHLLKSDDKKIESNLRRHKNYRFVPLIEINQSYRFLRKHKFTREALINVTQVLLYPSCKLKDALQEVKQHKHVFQKRLHLIEKLNLVLYFIEKEHHFTGNGIWTNEEENT